MLLPFAVEARKVNAVAVKFHMSHFEIGCYYTALCLSIQRQSRDHIRFLIRREITTRDAREGFLYGGTDFSLTHRVVNQRLAS